MLYRPILLAALAAAAIAAPQVPALAGTARLEWKDLDLSSEAGRGELDRRVDLAARRACTTAPNTGSRIAQAPKAECVTAAKSEIVAKLAARLPNGKTVAENGTSQAR